MNKRIENLQRIVGNRPVAILLPGYSIKELEKRIEELKDCDICYFTTNQYYNVLEEYILSKINRKFSVTMVSSTNLGSMIDNISSFLKRQEGNMFIFDKTYLSIDEMDEFKEYDEKLFSFDSTDRLSSPVPTKESPLDFLALCSFSILISIAIIGKASKVVIFGADGAKINPDEFYFRNVNDRIVEIKQFEVDTNLFNEKMPEILKRIYEVYNLKPIDIINCSEKSHYTPFKKVSYDEGLKICEKS